MTRLIALLLVTAVGAASSAQALPAVPKFGVFETRLTCADEMKNPFIDATMSAEFTSPSGAKVGVLGFCYAPNEWRVRFVPREEGTWQFAATLACPAKKHTASGKFECKGVEGHGFLRLSRRNNFRMEYDDATPFYPIGLQKGYILKPDFDGPNPDGTWRSTTPEEWAKAFDGAANLMRTQLHPGAFGGGHAVIRAGNKKEGTLPGPIDRYDTEFCAKMDDAFRLYRAHGFAQILNCFEGMSLWGEGKDIFGSGRDQVKNRSVTAPNMPDQERYLRYLVARFGCFVDVWELFNEDSWAPNDYQAHLARVIRDADPYAHIITTNYARPREPWCEIVTWHEYMGMPANEVDLYLASQIAVYKSYGKVVQNTEFGNQGKLSNFDPVKWRIAVWTAFMNESGILFWDMSGRKTTATGVNRGGNANAYIGPDSRQHFRVLNAFTRDLPIDMKPVPIGWHEHNQIRTWALSNGQVTAVYVHHFADHAKEYQLPHKLYVETGPGKFHARWIDPEDGKETKVEDVSTASDYIQITLPPVKVDAACRIDRTGDAEK